jgi:hypothetical protein
MIKIDGPKIEYNLIFFIFFMAILKLVQQSPKNSWNIYIKELAIITGPTIFKNLKIRNIHGPTKYNTHTQIFWETFFYNSMIIKIIKNSYFFYCDSFNSCRSCLAVLRCWLCLPCVIS